MNVSKTRDVKVPERGTPKSAGLDFFVPNDWNDKKVFVLGPGERVLIPSGIKAKVPEGFALIAFNKSGISTKTGLVVGAQVVDEDYEGEIHISLINTNQTNDPKQDMYDREFVNGKGVVKTLNKNWVEITPGQKIVQFILLPVTYLEVTEVPLKDLFSVESTSKRKDKGFGSTGDK